MTDMDTAKKPTMHELKTDPIVFDAVASGAKTHEIRLNDRDFQVGDHLLLRRTRYSGEDMRTWAPLEYTGEQQMRTVSHIQDGYGLADGWVILSFAALSTPAAADAPEPEWTFVKDALPPKNTEVLVAFDGIDLPSTGQYTGSVHDRNGWCYPSENYGTADDDSDPIVIAWMPLPAAPTPSKD